MTTGPILGRELVRVARLPRTYRRRVLLTAVVLATLGAHYLGWWYWNHGDFTIGEMAWFAQGTLFNLVISLLGLTMSLVPALVGRGIAEERERRTLDQLLATRLSSAEIVAGMVAAGLVRYASGLATVLPVMIVLPILGGVDPRLVLLALAGSASTAFFLAGLSILVSIGARGSGRAVRIAAALGALWFLGPLVGELFVRWLFPMTYLWLRPVFEWWLASTPFSVIVAFGRSSLPDTVGRMIGLQLAGGTLMMAWAAFRLRAVARDRAGGDSSILGRRTPRLAWRPWPRPSIGDDPALWKEMHTSRGGTLARAAGLVCYLALLAGVGYGTVYFGRPAFVERFAQGDGPLAAHPDRLQFQGNGPFAAHPDRLQFNMYIRFITSFGEFFLFLTVAGLAAEGVATERLKETWTSLIATPLSGREILRAKMIGAGWRMRWLIATLVALWAIGLAAGSVHPLGFAASLMLLGAATWFFVALGTYHSLTARDLPQASTRTLLTVLALDATFLAIFLAPWPRALPLGAGSTPMLGWFALWSNFEVYVALGFSPAPRATPAGISLPRLVIPVLGTYLVGTIAYAMGAFALSRIAVTRFDRWVGRPQRASSESAEDCSSRPLGLERVPILVGSAVRTVFDPAAAPDGPHSGPYGG